MLLTVAGFLLLAIPLDAGGVRLAILLPVVGMFFTPLACALPACFGVVRIGCNLLSAVAGTPSSLATGLATNGLRGLTFRGDEGLVAVRTTSLDHRGVVAFQRRRNLETNLEYLPRPRRCVFAWPHWPRLSPAEMATFFTGSNTRETFANKYYAGFVQNDFHVSKKLTLNLGLRYDYETARTDRFNNLDFFNPTVINPVGQQVELPNLRGGLQYVGVNGNPREQANPDRNNFGPRFGFAYNATPKTVIRVG
jgi:outer membrane receptor protein involved in Fe transport